MKVICRLLVSALMLGFSSSVRAQNTSNASPTPHTVASQSQGGEVLWYGKAPPGWGGSVTKMKLIAPGVGWAVRAARLYWTDDDGATWRDITPKAGHYPGLSAVFFLNPSTGWVAVNDPVSEQSTRNYMYLFSTTDAGATWSRTTIPESPTVNGDSGDAVSSRVDDVAFVDSVHG
jgi:hypothetical protein